MTVMIFIFVFWFERGLIASDTQRVTFLLTGSTFICNFFSHHGRATHKPLMTSAGSALSESGVLRGAVIAQSVLRVQPRVSGGGVAGSISRPKIWLYKRGFRRFKDLAKIAASEFIAESLKPFPPLVKRHAVALVGNVVSLSLADYCITPSVIAPVGVKHDPARTPVDI